MPEIRRCERCRHEKPIPEYYPSKPGSKNPYQEWCKECDTEAFRAHREGREPQYNIATHDMFGNPLPVNADGRPVYRHRQGQLKLTSQSAHTMIEKAKRTPFLQDVADAGGIRLDTLKKYLSRDDEPYFSFAARLRSAINTSHRERLWLNLLDQSDAGEVRATLEALKVVDPTNFRDNGTKIDITHRQGAPDIDYENLPAEALERMAELRDEMRALTSGDDGDES